MGNKLGRKKQTVDEKYTRPQGLDFDIDVDIKKLRKLILESKLAPCYPGDDECCCDLEECPICFLYYPSLNRSRCCTKSICTECFLQMKNPNSARPTQCPFCKTPNYAVEYRGVKTKEEKGLEQIEEQRVMEAQLRMRQQELQDEEERMQKIQELSLSSGIAPGEVQDSLVAGRSSGVEEVVSSRASQAASMIKQPLNPKSNRDDEFDLDLEDIMVTEAIWQSIQEKGRPRNSNCGGVASPVQYVLGDRYISPAMTTMAGSSPSASDRHVCTVAAFSEHHQMTGEPSSSYNFSMPTFNMLPSSGRFYNRSDRIDESYPCPRSQVDMSADSGMTAAARDYEEWGIDHRSEMAEAGTSYANSDVIEDGVISTILQDEVRGSFRNVPEPIVPESYEEQMTMAMTISLAEGRARTRGLGISWQ